MSVKKSDEYKKLKAIIAEYKAVNPEGYEAKKKELAAKLKQL